MYAIARLGGYIEELGFKAMLARDIANALGMRVGDVIRLESKMGLSAARVVEIRDDIKAQVILSLDAYMAVSGLRTVLIKKLPRVYEAEGATIGIEGQIDVGQIAALLNVLVAYRVPIFSNFGGYVQLEDRRWVKVVVKEVRPREPAYLSRETRLYIR